ncbi:MAG: thioredoxin family protein [Chitinispirillaceae bacterium]|nr:thioredoxin family protein [Chitinispirillaceae bacterium]
MHKNSNPTFLFLSALVSLLIGCLNGPITLDPVDTKNVVDLDTLNFKRIVIDSKAVAMVDFYSPGCHFCISSIWITDSMAKVFNGKALIGKVDIDQNDTLWKQYQINSLPTFVFFKNGGEIARRALWQIEDNDAEYDSLAQIMRDLIAGGPVGYPQPINNPSDALR